MPRSRLGARTAGLAGIAAMVLVLALLAIGGAFSSGASHRSSTASARSGSSPATSSPAASSYSNPGIGVSFSYPSSWHALTLAGTVADFGVNNGTAAETRCLLEIQRGAGPSSNTQEAQFTFVRARSAQGARVAKHYQLRAIQAEQGANVTGVGLIRVADGQGGHLGFFFRGRDVYVFDCITPAASLDQVDQQDFRPLLASVRLG
jgi:hypothetical protein